MAELYGNAASRSATNLKRRLHYIVMAYIVMAYIVMAYTVMENNVMAYIVMAYIVMAYIVMAYIVMAYIVMAYIVMAYTVMAYIVMAYIVMAELYRKPASTSATNLKKRLRTEHIVFGHVCRHVHTTFAKTCACVHICG